jgi:RHS repeat-associated protein
MKQKRSRSPLAALLGFTLLASTVAAVPASAAPREPASKVDLAAAAAANADEPTLVDRLTSETTQVIANPDGTFTAEITPGPVRVQDPNAPTGWTPIDTSLVKTEKGIFPVATVAKMTLSDGRTPRAVEMDLGQQSFAITWPSDLPVPTLAGDTATYSEVIPGIDLTIRAKPAGFEQDFLVREPPKEPLVFRLPLVLDGATASVDEDGTLTIARDDGTKLASADPALMWDSSLGEHTDEPEHSAKVQTRLVGDPKAPVLEVIPDASFFANPKIVYPVVIDPSPDLQVTKDTYVESQYPNQGYGTNDELKLGTPNGGTQKARTFITFGLGPVMGTHILSAGLKLWENWSYSCTATEVRIFRLTESYSVTTWNNQPSTSAVVWAKKSFAKGYSSSCPDAWITIDGGDGGDPGYTIVGLIQGLANGTYNNYGFALRAASETNSQSWKQFNSSDNASHQPYLTVTYNSYPNTPTSLSPSSGGYQTTTTPVLNGKFSDPDGSTGRVNYEVRLNSNGNLVVASSTTRAKVSSGSLHPWTIPSGNLTNGTVYKWRARGDDGTDVSSWTSYRTFTVDTTAPSTPTISSSTHPSQSTWYAASLDDVSASWTASTDATSGVAGYGVVWDQDPDTIPSGSLQTAATFTRNDVSPAGVWYLHVRPKDNAGNWGSTATFAVHLGQAAVTSPAQGDESVQMFTLAGSAAPSQATATFQYRHSPTDTTCGASPGDWCDIPPADVGLSSWPVTLDGSGNTPALTWDASATLGAIATAVQVRLVGGLGTASDPVDLAYVPNTSEATATAGPGSVDLSTGSLTLSASDVSVFGLGVFRTFSSRTPSDPSAGIFGPGWTSGLDSYSAYVSLSQDPGAGTVTVTPAAGQPLVYMENTDGSFETPSAAEDQEDEPAGTLSFASASFTLTENDGTETIFEKPSGADAFVPTEISTPAAESTMQTVYHVNGGIAQPTKMIDAVPDGVSGCATTPVVGCRLLTFTYATATTATGTTEANWGDFEDQVKAVSFTGYDPSTSSMQTVDVASYLYDSNGRLRAAWDPRISPALKTRYGYDSGGHVTALTPPGLNAWTFTYATITGDSNEGRLVSVSRPGVPSGTATTTFLYRVPVSGSGAPYAMNTTAVDDWGQAEAPVTATAIFPPGHDPSGNPPSSYEWATLQYLDADGRIVNSASSDGTGGAFISATEHNEFGAVIRSLTPANRARILTGVPDSSVLWSRNVYSADGVDLLERFGPMHAVQLSDGTIQPAQTHTTYTYDENPPQGVDCPCHLVTNTTEGARVQGATSDTDVRTTETTYDWDLLLPTDSIVDPVGLALETRQLLDPDTGEVTETRMPADPDGGDAHSTSYLYYAAGTGSGDSACNSHPEWANLLCKTKPAAQPSTGNNLPVTTYEYDLLGSVTEKSEVVSSPSATRTTTLTYDDAGRLEATSISGPGTSVPSVSHDYSSSAGLPTTASTSSATITREYDALGRLESYTDADGNVSTYAYDLQNRPTSVYDGKGTYTLSYDEGNERRGQLTTLADSQAGSFEASYDAGGALMTQTYPNGMTASVGYDEVGAATSLVYTKTTNCSADCDWYSDQVLVSAHGQWLTETSSLATQSYNYDQAGRLTGVDDTPVLPGSPLSLCTRRAYAYDADSNRTSLTTWDPDPTTGDCNSTGSGTTRAWTYDEADRVTVSGYSFDAFGRITQVPAADAGGSQMTLGYHANDRVGTLTASGITDTVTIDPTNRIRTLQIPSATQTWHYTADTDSPSWIAENAAGSTWSRNVAGPAGRLVAVADQSDTAVLQLTNLHGDVVATASTSGTANSLLSAADQTEFGVPRSPSTSRYGWLGGYERATDPATGSILMGARVYVPIIGRFLQPDPPASCSGSVVDLRAYTYARSDPVNDVDIQGTVSVRCFVGCAKYYLGYLGVAFRSGVVHACGFAIAACGALWFTLAPCIAAGICIIVALGWASWVVTTCWRQCR